MRSLVTYRRDGRIGHLTFDNPPVNAISRAVVAALKTALARFEADPEAAALVIACEGRTFVAGGDIADFELADFSAQPFNVLLARIEAGGRPVVAAMHGTVLGGGLELAMACHHRVAHPSTRFGLAEIKLGLLPGSLGTQRLPRLVGAQRALEMILCGDSMSAKRAAQSGLIDALSDAAPAEAGAAAAEALVAARVPIRRVSSLTVAPVPEGFFQAARERASHMPGYPAPAAIVRCVQAAVELPFGQGEALEAREFEALVASPASRALRHLFFAQREAAKIPGLARELPARGFIGNRMAEVYLREADFLLLEGAQPQQVDAAAEALGMAMGPCRMLDMAGLDVGARVVIERGKTGGLPPDPAYRAVVRRLHELGRHGQKTGAGYYRYEGRTAIADPAVTSIVRSLAQAHGIAQRKAITDQEIVERLFFTMINEGLNILEEGIAYRPGDIDVVWVAGYGFPDHLGGPMFMADQKGLPAIAQRLAHYARERGNPFGYWSPSPRLTRLVEAGVPLEDRSAAVVNAMPATLRRCHEEKVERNQ